MSRTTVSIISSNDPDHDPDNGSGHGTDAETA
jgi:hypothetical protein